MNRCFCDLAVFIEDHHLDGTPPTLAPVAQAMLATPTITRSRPNAEGNLACRDDTGT